MSIYRELLSASTVYPGAHGPLPLG